MTALSIRPETATPGFNRLKRTILLLAAGITALTFTFEGIRLYIQFHQTRSDVNRQITSHVLAVTQHTERIMEGVDLALKQTADAYHEQWLPENRSAKEIHQFMAAIKSRLPQLRDIILLGPDGVLRHDSGIFPPKVMDLSDREYYRVHQENPDTGLYVGKPLKGRASGKWFLSASRRIGPPGAPFAGVVCAIVDPLYFWEFYDLLSRAHGMDTLFFHNNGIIIAGSKDLIPGQEHPSGLSLEAQPFFSRLPGPGETAATPLPLRGRLLNTGERHLAAATELAGADTGRPTLRIMGFISTDNAYDAFYRSLKSEAAFGLSLLVLATGLVIVSFRQINARQQTHEELVRAVEEKEAAQTELHALNIDLEKRVQDRTSELSRALDHVRSLQDSMVEQEKLASLGQLVAGIAHEVNSPLGASLTAVTAITEKTETFRQKAGAEEVPAQALHKFLDTLIHGATLVKNNIQRAADLTRSFKQVAADRQVSEIREVNLGDCITDIASSLHPQAKRAGITLETDCAPDLPCNIDPGAMAQVLTNLVMNALMHAFGKSDIGTGTITIALAREEKSAVITVSDNGRGMPADVRDKIFDPFFTTKRGSGGTGLGLHIVYNIVRARLSGTISVDSAPGHGTRVAITLPKAYNG